MDGSGIKTISQDAVNIQKQQGILDIVIAYDGMFSNNLFLGFGTATYLDGSKYSGHWESSQRHGIGRLEFSTNYYYHGSFRNNRYHGRGLLEHVIEENDNDQEPETSLIKVVNYIEKHGGHYRGDFYYGVACGFGILTTSSGLQIKGVFKNDKLLNPFSE
jgi:hypothetical protein